MTAISIQEKRFVKIVIWTSWQPPKACDPWAVYSAKKTVSPDMILTAEQQKIFTVIKTKGPVTRERICDDLALSEEDFRNNFVTLRHMELAKACKKQGIVCYALFEEQCR